MKLLWQKKGIETYYFRCPGCGHGHVYNVSQTPSHREKYGEALIWQFNGNLESPSFTPSLLNWHDGDKANGGNIPPSRCHLYITDGNIKYLDDCTHAFAGKTIPMEDIGGVIFIKEAGDY